MKTARRKFKAHQAFSVLECMVYIAVLVILMGLAFQAFSRSEKNSYGLRRNANDVVKALKAGEQWREDIRKAAGEITVSEENQKSAVRIPYETGAVTYIFDQGKIFRRIGDRETELLRNVRGSTMQPDIREHVSAWKWELELKSAKSAKLRPLFTFEAVPPKK